MAAVWKAVLTLYGEYGASQTGLRLIHYNQEQQRAVLRTFHTALDMVRTAVATITKIGDRPIGIHVTAISGTIKALSQKVPI